MSRSRRSTPIVGMTKAESDKAFKAASHRQERAAVRTALSCDGEPPHHHAFGSSWDSQKDGKQWLGERHPDLMRK